MIEKDYLGIVDVWGHVRIKEWTPKVKGHDQTFGVVTEGITRYIHRDCMKQRFRLFNGKLYWWRSVDEECRISVLDYLWRRFREEPPEEVLPLNGLRELKYKYARKDADARKLKKETERKLEKLKNGV